MYRIRYHIASGDSLIFPWAEVKQKNEISDNFGWLPHFPGLGVGRFRGRHREFMSFEVRETEGKQRNSTALISLTPASQGTQFSIELPTWTFSQVHSACTINHFYLLLLLCDCSLFLHELNLHAKLSIGIQRPNPRITQHRHLSSNNNIIANFC